MCGGHFKKAQQALRLATQKRHMSADVPVLSPKRARHILYGDQTGGCHLREFPRGWNNVDVIAAVLNVASDIKVKWHRGRGGNLHGEKDINGVCVHVITDPNKKVIITAYPRIKTGENKMKQEFDKKKNKPENKPATLTQVGLSVSSGGPYSGLSQHYLEAQLLDVMAKRVYAKGLKA